MTERRPSRLEAAVAEYRARLERLDAAALGALEVAYSPGRESVLETIEQLVRQIEQAGGDMTPGEAARLSRATELLRLIEAETTRLAQAANQAIPNAQQAAVAQAIQRAEALALAQAPDERAAAELARQWTAMNREAMANLVGQLSDGSPLNEWLQNLAGETTAHARSVLMDGITRGLSPRTIGSALARTTGMPLRRAHAAARTSMMDSYRSASLQTMAANDDILAGWQWSAAHQTRTCLSCLSKDDGTVYPLSVQFMPAHVNCRCSPIPVLKDDEDAPPIETGAEWFAKQPASVKAEMIPPGLRDDFTKGRVRLQDMSTLDRNPDFGDRWRQSTITEARAAAAARRSGRGTPTPAAPPTMTPEQQFAETLEQSERSIWKRSTEEAIVIDPSTGREVFRVGGEESRVDFTDDHMRRMKGMVTTHNHPAGWKAPANSYDRQGNSFSLADIALAIKTDMAEIRAVSPSWRFSMRPGPQGWNPMNLPYTEVLPRMAASVQSEMYERIRRGEITIQQAEAEHNHRVMERLAERWGLTYTREPVTWSEDE